MKAPSSKLFEGKAKLVMVFLLLASAGTTAYASCTSMNMGGGMTSYSCPNGSSGTSMNMGNGMRSHSGPLFGN